MLFLRAGLTQASVKSLCFEYSFLKLQISHGFVFVIICVFFSSFSFSPPFLSSILLFTLSFPTNYSSSCALSSSLYVLFPFHTFFIFFHERIPIPRTRERERREGGFGGLSPKFFGIFEASQLQFKSIFVMNNCQL